MQWKEFLYNNFFVLAARRGCLRTSTQTMGILLATFSYFNSLCFSFSIHKINCARNFQEFSLHLNLFCFPTENYNYKNTA